MLIPLLLFCRPCCGPHRQNKRGVWAIPLVYRSYSCPLFFVLSSAAPGVSRYACRQGRKRDFERRLGLGATQPLDDVRLCFSSVCLLGLLVSWHVVVSVCRHVTHAGGGGWHNLECGGLSKQASVSPAFAGPCDADLEKQSFWLGRAKRAPQNTMWWSLPCVLTTYVPRQCLSLPLSRLHNLTPPPPPPPLRPHHQIHIQLQEPDQT